MLKKETSDEPLEIYSVESLIRKYGNDVLRTAYMYVGNMDEAEDIFQMVFIKVYEKLGTFRNDSSIKTWIIRITINTCKDVLKSSWKKKVSYITPEQEDEFSAEDQYQNVEKEADAVKLKEAVAALPLIYREVVICVFYQEMSVKEAALVLKIPEGTVKSRLNRAKQELRKALKGECDYDF